MPGAGQFRAWNPLWSSNPTDYFRSYQNGIVADNWRSQSRPSPEPPAPQDHDDGFRIGSAYGEFFRFNWWTNASTGQRVVGGTIAGIAALAGVGALILGGEFIGGAAATAEVGGTSWALGGAALLHGGAYAAVAATQCPVENSRRPNLPSLVERARSGLEAWRRDPNARFDHGHFLIDAEREAAGLPAGDYRAWDDLVQRVGAQVRGEGDPFAQLAVLRRQLYLLADTGHYRLRNAGIGDLLQGQGGNCSARGKVVMAMIAALNIRLPEPWILGLQNYNRHLEPVAYNPRTQERLNLRTGETSRGLDSHLYSPMLLPQAYLRARRMNSPVSDDQLILARATVPARPPRPSNPPALPPTNDVLVFPPSEFESDASFPEEAFEAPPRGNPVSSAGPSRGPSGPTLPSYSADTWPDRDEFGLGELQDRIRTMVLPFQAPTTRRLLFRDPSQSEFYNSLPPQDRGTYLTQVFRRDMATFLARPEVLRVMEGLSHPETFFSTQNPEVDLQINTLRQLHRRIAEFDEIRAGQGMPNLWVEGLRAFGPEFQGMAEAMESFNSYLRSHSSEFLQNLEAMPGGERFVALRFLQTLRSFYPIVDLGPFEDALSLAGLSAGRRRPAGNQAATAMPSVNLPRGGAVEIELWGPPNAEAPAQTGVGSASTPASPPADISYRTFFEALIVTGSQNTPLYRRWTPEVSAQFLRLNRNGFYSGMIPFIWMDLVGSRHPSIPREQVELQLGVGRQEPPSGIDPDLREIFRSIQRRTNRPAVELPPDED